MKRLGLGSGLSLIYAIISTHLSYVHATSGVVIGKKYVVPPPDILETQGDYKNLTNQCIASKNSPGCIYALNQYTSDAYLMVPDTRDRIAVLNDKITTDKGVASYKQSQLTALQGTVETISSQLIAAASKLDDIDRDYYTRLGDLNADVGAMLDPQTSPAYTAATSQRQAMLDRITALSSSLTSYLAGQSDVVKSTANQVFNLFKNDQAIIQADASSQLASAVDQAANLTRDIDLLRQGYQQNVSAALLALQQQKDKIAAAKTDADGKLKTAKDTIITSIKTGTDTAVAQSRAEYQTALANVTAFIDSIRNASVNSFDSKWQLVLDLNTNTTKNVSSNITAIQSMADGLGNLIDVRVRAAAMARDDTVRLIASTQDIAMHKTKQNGDTMNQTLAAYTEKTAQTSSKIFGQSQNFMLQFANMASDAANQVSGSMKSDAVSGGDAMSNLNRFIGDMSGKASTQSRGITSSISDSINAARDSIGMTGIKQIMALADSINTINTLVNFLKAKLSFSSDKSGSQVSSISDLLTASVNDMQATLRAIVDKVTKDVMDLTNDYKNKVNVITSSSNTGRRNAETQLNQIRMGVEGKINTINIKRTEAAGIASKLTIAGQATAKRIGSANEELSGKVTAMRNRIGAKWDKVTASNAEFQNSVKSALGQLSAKATELANAQQGRALDYINSRKSEFSNLISGARNTALSAQTVSIGQLNATAFNLMGSLNKTKDDAAAVVADAVKLVNSGISSLTALQPVFVTAANNATVTAQQNALKTIAALKTKIDTTKNQLSADIYNRTGEYLNTNMAQLSGAEAGMIDLFAKVDTQIKVGNTLFSDGDDLFGLNSTQFKAKLVEAAAAVTSANSMLKGRYAELGANLTVAYKGLSDRISKIDSSQTTLASNVTAQVNSAVSAAQTKLDSEKRALIAYADQLVANVLADANKMREIESNTTKSNTAEFDNLMDAARNTSQNTFGEITKLSADEEVKQAMIADAMDEIVKSLMMVSGNNAELLNKLKAQFISLQGSTFGLSDKLNSSLTLAISQVDKASVKAQADLQAKIEAETNKAVKDVSSLGTRLSYAMDVLERGNADELSSLSDADADALRLARSIGDLGATTKAKIQDVVNKIMSGQMSMDQVINSQSQLNVAQLRTVKDVIAAFTSAMNGHVTKSHQMYQSEIDRLLAYNETVPQVVGSYESSRAAAAQQAQLVIKQANDTANTYAKTTKDVVAFTDTAVHAAEKDLFVMKNSIPVEIDKIKAAIKAAVTKVEASQDEISRDLIQRAKDAKSDVVNRLRAFREKRNKSTFTLSVDAIATPTTPPLIDLGLI